MSAPGPPGGSSLPGWLVPATAVALAAIAATLLLTLRSSSTPQQAATETARTFANALNDHDVSTVQSLACASYSDKAKKLADSLQAAHAQVAVGTVHTTTKSRAEATLTTHGAKTAVPTALTLDVEQHAGLWLVCGQS